MVQWIHRIRPGGRDYIKLAENINSMSWGRALYFKSLHHLPGFVHSPRTAESDRDCKGRDTDRADGCVNSKENKTRGISVQRDLRYPAYNYIVFFICAICVLNNAITFFLLICLISKKINEMK